MANGITICIRMVNVVVWEGGAVRLLPIPIEAVEKPDF